jgi:ribosomal protein S18 acetylase RimI-like enzyme
MSLNFKKATIVDIPLIRQLADRIWKQHYITIITMEQIEYMLNKMYSVESLSDQINRGHNFTLVYDKDKAIGYISLESKNGKDYFLHKFYIEVNDQRRGIGSSLFDSVEKGISGATTIELTVNRQNYKAINFYFKKGFVIKEIADFDIGNGYFMNDFVMIKRIK